MRLLSKWFMQCCVAVVVCAPQGGGASPLQVPSPQAPLTLEQATGLAISNYPQIRAAQAQLEAANALVGLSRTAYLPKADSSLLANRATRNNVFGLLLPQSVIPAISGPVLPEECFCTTWGSAAGLSFSWEPFDLGLRKANVGAATSVRDQASAGLELTQFEVVVRAVEAFFNVLASQESVRAAEATVERMRVFLNSVSVLVTNQLRPGADESRARAELAAAQTQLIRASELEQLNRATLAERLGMAGTPVTISPGPLLGVPPPSEFPSRDLASHPAAAAQAAAIEIPRARLQALERSYYPRFSFQSAISSRGTGARPDGTFLGGLHGLLPGASNWGIGFSVNFPLLDLPVIRQREQIEAQLERIEIARYDQVVQTLTAAADRARARLESARQVAANTPVQLEAARATEQQSGARYQAGLATVVEVAEAQRLLTQAEIDDALGRLDVWRALFEQSAARGDVQPLLDRIKNTPSGGQ